MIINGIEIPEHLRHLPRESIIALIYIFRSRK